VKRHDIFIVIVCMMLFFSPTLALARGGGSGGHSSGSHSSSHSSSKSSSSKSSKKISSGTKRGGSKKAVGVKRDKRGKIARSEKAKNDFMKQSGYPHGRPGYVVDHIVPLKKGGKDSPSNMQWQRKEDAKIKDKYE